MIPLVWRARRPLPYALRWLANPVTNPLSATSGAPPRIGTIIPCFLLVRVARTLRSLRLHTPRLCRFAVF